MDERSNLSAITAGRTAAFPYSVYSVYVRWTHSTLSLMTVFFIIIIIFFNEDELLRNPNEIWT